MNAIVATEHAILTACWHMLTIGNARNGPDPDHHDRVNPDRAKNNAIRRPRGLGYEVTLAPTAD